MNKKLILISLAAAVLMSCAFSLYDAALAAQHISESVVRLHIRADDNSKSAQDIKIKVRNAVLEQTKDLLDCTENSTDAQSIIKENIKAFEKAANDELSRLGAEYKAEAVFGDTQFPGRTYGPVKLPAGTYKSLVINLGSGKGDNWWCVMFPPLCYEGENVKADDSVLKVLKGNLPEDEFYILTGGGKTCVKFKVVEIAAKLKSFIKK